MGSYTGTVPTFLAGELVDADKLLEITNFMTALTSAWTAYSPSWTSTGTTPAIVNGSLTGFYRRMGSIVDVLVTMSAGSSTTFGTGEWRFSLPFTAANTRHIGSGYILDNGSQVRVGSCHMISTTTIAPDSNSGTCTASVPQTWVNGDVCAVQMTYEAA